MSEFEAPFTHLIVALRDRRVLARGRDHRLLLTRKVLARGEPFDLLAFRAADTHLHFAMGVPAAGAMEFARRIEISLNKTFGYGITFSSAYTEPIRSQRHLINVFWYVIGQEQRHGLDQDPWFEASNLPDLLGWRQLAPWAPGLTRSFLPRLDGDRMRGVVSVVVDPDRPASLDGLGAAAAGALGLLELPKRGPEFARLVAVACAAVGDDWPALRLARALDVSVRSVLRYRGSRPDRPLVRAIRCQSQLQAARRLASAG